VLFHGSLPIFRPSLGRLNRRGPIGDILAIAGRDRPPFPSGRYKGRPVLSGSWSNLAHSTRRRASQIACEPTENHSNETSDRCPDDQGGSNCCDATHTYPQNTRRRVAPSSELSYRSNLSVDGLKT
jgi:hypothetical protein